MTISCRSASYSWLTNTLSAWIQKLRHWHQIFRRGIGSVTKRLFLIPKWPKHTFNEHPNHEASIANVKLLSSPWWVVYDPFLDYQVAKRHDENTRVATTWARKRRNSATSSIWNAHQTIPDAESRRPNHQLQNEEAQHEKSIIGHHFNKLSRLGVVKPTPKHQMQNHPQHFLQKKASNSLTRRHNSSPTRTLTTARGHCSSSPPPRRSNRVRKTPDRLNL